MEERLARFRLRIGLAALDKKRAAIVKREKYLRGDHDRPFAPEGVNEEYRDLQDQAIAPYFGIAVNAPVQRLRAEGIKTGDDSADKAIWAGAWKANRMDTRQTIVFRSMVLHSRGIVSVWPNAKDKSKPIVRPESVELVHVEMDPDDPFTPLWVLKAWTTTIPDTTNSGLVLPSKAGIELQVAVVYDDDSFLRFEKRKGDNDWVTVVGGGHPMKRPPFALYDYKTDDLGQPWSTMDALIPQQDAINTIRFNTLLAMQFSAFRQRIITGFDPRATDKDGNFLYKRDPKTGDPVTDANGNAIPILNTPGRAGVDRILAFPGGDTKVFDLAESNLNNYVEVLNAFLVQFFSTGQIPPQYLLNQMSNLSGDALAGAESTLASLVQDLQLAGNAGNEQMSELAWHAMGNAEPFAPGVETRWADAQARSFAQVADAIVKLTTTGFPKRAAWEMLPGTTPEKLQEWMDAYEDEQYQSAALLAMRPLVDATGGTPSPLPAGENGQAAIEGANGAAAGSGG